MMKNIVYIAVFYLLLVSTTIAQEGFRPMPGPIHGTFYFPGPYRYYPHEIHTGYFPVPPPLKLDLEEHVHGSHRYGSAEEAVYNAKRFILSEADLPLESHFIDRFVRLSSHSGPMFQYEGHSYKPWRVSGGISAPSTLHGQLQVHRYEVLLFKKTNPVQTSNAKQDFDQELDNGKTLHSGWIVLTAYLDNQTIYRNEEVIGGIENSKMLIEAEKTHRKEKEKEEKENIIKENTKRNTEMAGKLARVRLDWTLLDGETIQDAYIAGAIDGDVALRTPDGKRHYVNISDLTPESRTAFDAWRHHGTDTTAYRSSEQRNAIKDAHRDWKTKDGKEISNAVIVGTVKNDDQKDDLLLKTKDGIRHHVALDQLDDESRKAFDQWVVSLKSTDNK